MLAALAQAGGETSTLELCTLAGFNNFEHHAYVLPQLRALARPGVITRTRRESGRAVYWCLNTSDQEEVKHTAAVSRALTEVRRHARANHIGHPE